MGTRVIAFALGVLFISPAYCLAGDAPPKGKSRILPLKPGVLRPDRGFVTLNAQLGRCTEKGDVVAYGHLLSIRRETKRGRTGIRVKVGEEKEKSFSRFPIFLDLRADKEKRGVCIIPWAGGKFLCISTYGVRFSIDGSVFYLIDANMNDRIGEPGLDGLAGPNSLTVGRYNERFWTVKNVYRVSLRGEEGKAEVTAEGLSFTRDPDIRGAWCLINAWRARIDSMALEWDPAMAKGCKLHATYCRANGTIGHDEDPHNGHYTREGAAAGRESVGGGGTVSHKAGVLNQLRLSFHGEQVLFPHLRRSGFGLDTPAFFMNTRRGRSPDLSLMKERPVVLLFWPPHGAEDVFKEFAYGYEVPMPVRGEERNEDLRLGQVVFAGVWQKGKFEIVLKDERGAPVDAHGTSATNPVDFPGIYEGFGYGDFLCLAPKSSLRSKARYFVEVLEAGKGPGSLVFTWSFRTR
ncbi:MAG: CAP domain-containing protein [Planctomycetota bacterium]